MSTSPRNTPPAEDEIVGLLSRWLAFQLGNDELRTRLEATGTDGLEPEQARAVEELLDELAHTGAAGRGDLEMLVRETLEAVVLGG
jgi:hypothetical protein